MRGCSLLQLSSYLDGELEPGRRGEVEAHVVGCERCRNGLGHLNEEVERIGALARVQVSAQSARLLLEQVGLAATGEAVAVRSPRRAQPAPRRATPDPPGGPSGAAGPPQPADGGQIDLPGIAIGGGRANAGESKINLPAPIGAIAYPIPDAGIHLRGDPTVAPTPPARSDRQSRSDEYQDDEYQDSDAPGLGPSAVPTPPRKVARPGGSLVARVRERVALQRALTKASGHDLDDSVEVYSRRMTARPDPAAETATEDGGDFETEREVLGTSSRRAVANHLPRRRERTRPAADDRRPREPVGTGTEDRLAASARSLTSTLRQADAALRERPRTSAFAAGTLVLLAVGLAAGKATSVPAPAAASSPAAPQSRQSTGSAAPLARSAPANPAPAIPSSAGSALQLTDVRTLGSGGTGWQIKSLRYGAHPGDFRIVFDLEAGSAAAGGAPKTTLGFTDPTTMYVLLDGVVPAGTVGALPSTSTVAAVNLVAPPPSPGQTVYQFKLAHPLGLAQQYVTAPLRLVLDLH